MKKVFTFLLLTFLFIININADVTMSYDKAVNNSQRYVYKFNKYGKYIITDKKYIEIVNSDTAIIPFAFKNNKSTVNTDFTRGGLLNEEEFIVSKDSNGNTYLSQDVEFFLMKDGTIKAINVLNNDVKDAGDKKYALRVTEFVIPGTKTKGSGTKNNPWEFVGTYKLTFYIENGKITNNNLLVNKYIVYAVESTAGQIVINFKPDSSFTYYNNNCDFEYEYDKTNKIHRIFKPNKDITSDKECTINLIATGLLVQYDLNGGTGNCESLSVTKGSKLTNICTSVSKPGYMFKGWKDASGNIVTKDTIVNDNLKLTAEWEIKKYTLTINPNGGTWNNTTSNSTKTGTTNSKLSIANPTPKGYTVSFNSNGGNNVNSITSQRTFTNWSLSGSGSMSGTTYTFGSGNATLTANYNNGSITLPSATKAGHNFKGWYSNGCGSTFIGNAGESYTPTSNVTLRACYSYYAYILDVYPNGGTWNGTTEKTRIEPLANPKPSIYGNTDYTGKIGSTIDIPNPTPPSGYTVSFNTNGGSSVSSITSTKLFNGWNNSSPGTFSGTTYTYGEGSGYITANYKNNSVNLPKPTKSGYTFVGWYTASSGGTKVNNTYTPTENITLYAHWNVNSYTLSFDANGCGTLGVSYVTATVGKTYGDADDGDGLPSIALTTGKNFDGWYTSSSGGNKITNSTTVTASSDNGTLYAHCSYINYNINYNLANGTHGSSHPTSAKYEDVINISKPSKKVTINLSRGTNASNATISSTSVSAAQTFAGWTATNLNTTTARRGTSSSSVNTQWSSGSTKSTYTYYKNLTVTNNATVKLTANWTQKSVTLPTITKSGYKCGWATSSTATTYTYESGATYVPNANGSSNLTLYGVCKHIAPPSLTVKFTTSAGYTNTCTDTYTTSHGSCTFNDGYYAPLSLSIVATDTNTVTNMKLEYNKPEQTSYTDIIGSYELSPTKSGNTYTATTSIGSTGKRKLRITATNSQGKTSTVILNINIIPQTFAAQNNCSDKTLTAAGNIFVWKGESSCTNANKSPCGQMQADTIGLISQGAELCYVKTISSSSNIIFIAAWIEKSQFKYKGGVLTEGYPGYGTATTKTFNGKTYYYSKLTAWCNNASCGYGWVIKPEI
mgnify:CR=1 FL=1